MDMMSQVISSISYLQPLTVNVVVAPTLADAVFWTSIGFCNMSVAPSFANPQLTLCNCGLPSPATGGPPLGSPLTYAALNLSQLAEYPATMSGGACCVDFTAQVMHSAVSVLVNNEEGLLQMNYVNIVTNTQFQNAIMDLIAAVICFSIVLQICEILNDDDFTNDYRKGFNYFLFWVTFTIVPAIINQFKRTPKAKVTQMLSGFWIFGTVVLLAYVTGISTSVLAEVRERSHSDALRCKT